MNSNQEEQQQQHPTHPSMLSVISSARTSASQLPPAPATNKADHRNRRNNSASLQVLGGGDARGDALDAFINSYSNVDMNTDGEIVQHVSAASSSSSVVAVVPAAADAELPAETVRRLEAVISELEAAASHPTLQPPRNNRVLLLNARAELAAAHIAVTAAAAATRTRPASAPVLARRGGRNVGGAYAGSHTAAAAARTGATAAAAAAAQQQQQLEFPATAPIVGVPSPIGDASAALPSSSPHATSAADTQRIAARQNLSNEDEFWARWIGESSDFNQTSTYLRIVERVSYRGIGGVLHDERERDFVLKVGGPRVENPSVQLSENDGLIRRADRNAAQRKGTAPLASNMRVRKMRTFTQCSVIHTFTEGWSDESYPYGRFPLLPGKSSIGNCRALSAEQQLRAPFDFRNYTFETRYESFQVLSSAYIDGLLRERAARQLRTDLHVAGPDALRPRSSDAMNLDGSNVWSCHKIESQEDYDAIAKNTLNDMLDGVFIPMSKTFTSEHSRLAFRNMQLNNIRGYPEAAPQEKERMWIRWLAAPAMCCRRLQGSKISQRLRVAHEHQQLNVHARVILTETNQPAPRPESSVKVSAEDFDVRCVRNAYTRAKEGEVGRGSSALQREQSESVPFSKQRSDLDALHGDGAEYDPATGGDPSGATLKLPAHVTAMVYTTEHVKVEDLRRFAKGCLGAAPGPDGMTGAHLVACLEDDELARCFQHMMIDVLNAQAEVMTNDIIDFLIASILRGIPKGKVASDGTRPLALGSTTLKIAAHVADKHAAPETRAIFAGTQFGSTKGGSEFIVHALRRFIDHGVFPDGRMANNGRVVVAIDEKNAFNMFARSFMFADAGKIAALHGFMMVSYLRPARLIFVGHTDPTEYVRSRLKSLVHLFHKRGVRQGEVNGVTIFNLSQQDCLNAVRNIPGCQVLCYIDDAYILAESLEAAAAATEAYIRVLESKGGLANELKSEVLPVNGAPFIDAIKFPRLAKFRCVKVLKALGASIGLSRAMEKEHLEARMKDKFVTMIRRLRMCPSPQLFSILRLCFLPKLGHALRTHAPEVTRDLCQMFDALISDTIRAWASMPCLSPRQLAMIQLPLNLGGMGFGSQELLAPAAYKASIGAALNGSVRVVRLSTINAALFAEAYAMYTANDPLLVDMLAYSRLKGTDCGLTYCGTGVHPDVFSCLLRWTLNGSSITAPANVDEQPCPGCKAKLRMSNGDWGNHVISCVTIKGGLVTVRHNQVSSSLRHLMAEAGGCPDAGEPRHLRHVQCACNTRCPQTQYEEHKRLSGCSRGIVHTSGPDILNRPPWLHGAVAVYDVTIVSPRVASNRGLTVELLFKKKTDEKKQKYEQHCLDAGITTFITLVATPNGHLGDAIVNEMKRCCSLTLGDARIEMTKLSATISRCSAAALLDAETKMGWRPPSQHLDKMRLSKSFAQVPLDSNHDADTPKSSSLPRDDGAPQQHGTLPFPTGGPALAALIAGNLPPSLRAAIVSVAETAVADAIRAQQSENDERKEATRLADERARAAAATAAAAAAALLPADPAPDVMTVDDAVTAFRQNVIAEVQGNERRANDESQIRELERSLSTARDRRGKRNAETATLHCRNMSALAAAAEPVAALLTGKAARAQQGRESRERLLELSVRTNQDLERDIAREDSQYRSRQREIEQTIASRERATANAEQWVDHEVSAIADLDQRLYTESKHTASLQRKFSESRARNAAMQESQEFQQSLRQYVVSKSGSQSRVLGIASPGPVNTAVFRDAQQYDDQQQYDSNGYDVGQNQRHYSNAFLGQENAQPLIPGQNNGFNGFMYEEGGAVAPVHGYGCGSRARSSAPEPQRQQPSSSSSSRSQQQHQSSSSSSAASPGADPHAQAFRGRTQMSSVSLPRAPSHPTLSDVTPAASSRASSVAVPAAPQKQQQQQQSRASSVADPSRLLAMQSLSSADARVTSGAASNNNQRRAAATSSSSSSSVAAAAAARSTATNATSAQQAAPGRQEVSSRTKHNSLTDFSAHQTRSSAPATNGVSTGGGAHPTFVSDDDDDVDAAEGSDDHDDVDSPAPRRRAGAVSPFRE